MAVFLLLERLVGGGLDLSVSPTRSKGGSGVLAKNVIVYPLATITKRQGFVRAQEIDMFSPVITRFELYGKLISISEIGEIDAV